jgi:hypothetical protein
VLFVIISTLSSTATDIVVVPSIVWELVVAIVNVPEIHLTVYLFVLPTQVGKVKVKVPVQK